MKIFEVLLLIINTILEIWKHRQDPEQAKIRAAAAATKDLNEKRDEFNEALKNNDAAAISAHFQQLRDRVALATKHK